MLHGEFKTPGGKLVQVDLEVCDGRLCHVQVTGDFFLEPEEALETIRSAIEGVPVAEATEDHLAWRIRQALARYGRPVEMLGFSPESIAQAVRRALP